MPIVLHIMPKRVLAHYAAIIPKIFAHIMLALCRKFLKPAPRGAPTSRHHHFSAPCTKKANNVYKDWVTKGWSSVPQMDLAVGNFLLVLRNSNTLRYWTNPLHNSYRYSAAESLLQIGVSAWCTEFSMIWHQEGMIRDDSSQSVLKFPIPQ